MRNVSLFVSALLLVFALTYILLVYPNDRRISFPSETLPPLQRFRTKISSLFTDKIAYELTLSLEAYRKKLETFANSYGNHISWHSLRFRHPLQLYIAAGSHPHLIEGRDAIFLPSKEILTIHPALQGDVMVEFASVSPKADAVLTVGHGGRVREFRLPKVPELEDTESLLYRAVTRYLFPDRKPHTGVWQTHNLELSLEKGDSLRFSCQSDEDSCFLGDIRFMSQTTNRHPQGVVLILLDTFRYDAIAGKNSEFLGQTQSHSLDFVNAVGAGNMTSISTNALLSCQKPADLEGVAFSYGISNGDQESFYKKGRASFPELLRRNGIKTAAIGNISIISDILGIGVDHGFDDQFAIETEGYDTAQITRAAQHWLGQNGDQPFLLYLHYNSPHGPYRAPLRDVLATFNAWTSLSSLRNMMLDLYQAEVRYVDRYVEKIFETLDELGLREHTTVIITSDHGDHHEIRSFSDNQAGPPYVGSTFDHGETLYNDEIHVPLFINTPQDRTHRIVSTYVSSLDIGPTILDMFDIVTPSWCAGTSLIATDEEGLKERVVASEGFNQRAIFYDSKFKYIKTYASSKRSLVTPSGYWRESAEIFAEEQLFDIEKDPQEQFNLLRSDLATFTLMRDFFHDYYGITEQWDLLVDSLRTEPVEILFAPEDKHKLFWNDSFSESPAGVVFKAEGEQRVRISFREAPQSLPQVMVGGNSLEVTYTSYRLPLTLPFSELPLESGLNLDGLPLSVKDAAFFVRASKDPLKVRKIVIGNPQFERLFREWGYLNDNNGGYVHAETN
ncbi:MAG: sulfatase [Deltaproteobacteria bacterium]|nr:sulfatase [Deltaproteobacteria bacterium]